MVFYAITTRGLVEGQMEEVVEMIDRVLMSIDDDKTIQNVRSEVKEFMQAYPLYPELG